MEDSVAQLGAFVAATAPKPPPPPEYPGYEPVFKKHYPLFYKVCAPAHVRMRGAASPALLTYGRCLLAPAPQSLTTGFKPNEGYSYLSKDTPQLFGSLTQVGYLARTRARTHKGSCAMYLICCWMIYAVCMCMCVCGTWNIEHFFAHVVRVCAHRTHAKPTLAQDCTRAGAPAYCYGVTRKTIVKNGWGTSDSTTSTAHIFGA
jgi:hypothetical protein